MLNHLISIYNTNKKEYVYQNIFAQVSFLNSIRFESKKKNTFSEILSENFIIIHLYYLENITSKLSIIFNDKTYAINKILDFNKTKLKIFASNSN